MCVIHIYASIFEAILVNKLLLTPLSTTSGYVAVVPLLVTTYLIQT